VQRARSLCCSDLHSSNGVDLYDAVGVVSLLIVTLKLALGNVDGR